MQSAAKSREEVIEVRGARTHNLKLSGHIESVKHLLAKIKQTDFRLSKDIERKILLKANESD